METPPTSKDRIYFGTLEQQAQRLQTRDEVSSSASSSSVGAPETLPFSANILDSQKKHTQLLEQLEQTKRARSIAVPTNDNAVKMKLRALGEPIILFGEQPPERRERLRELLARQTVTDAAPSTSKKRQKEEQGEIYYTEGSPELKACRRWIASYSLHRAQERIEQAKKKRSEFNYEEEFKRTSILRDSLKKYRTTASQIGDDRPLSYCTFSPDDTLLATASWSGLAKVWDVETCEPKTILKGHTDRVGAVVFHPQACLQQPRDSLNLATCSADGSIKLWSLDGGAPLATLHSPNARLLRLAFHPSGRWIGTTSADKTWRLWDVEAQKELLIQEGHSREVSSISFHPDGSLVGTSGMDAYGRIWDLRTGKSAMVLKGHAKQVCCLDFAPNGFHLATGGQDNTVKIWDLRKKKCSYTIPAHSAVISHVKFQPGEGLFLVTASFDKLCRVWSTVDWSPITTLAGHEAKVFCVDIAHQPGPVGQLIASASFDRTWKVFKETDLLN